MRQITGPRVEGNKGVELGVETSSLRTSELELPTVLSAQSLLKLMIHAWEPEFPSLWMLKKSPLAYAVTKWSGISRSGVPITCCRRSLTTLGFHQAE